MNYIKQRSSDHNQIITIVLKAIKQKTLRNLHCIECGWHMADISEKVLVVFEGETPIETLAPDKHGFVEIHCRQTKCKQYYRVEFAV